MQRTKEDIDRAAKAFIADIDMEFGKKKKTATPPTKLVRTRQVSTGIEANRIAELMALNSPWRAIAVVSHLVTQTCRCCQGTVEYVGNVLIKHEHKASRAIWEHPIPPDPSHSFLPKEIVNFHIVVEECPSCIRTNFYQMSTDRIANQLSLFH